MEGKYLDEESNEKTIIIYFQLGANPTSDLKNVSFGTLDRIKLNYFLIDGTPEQDSKLDVPIPKDYSRNGDAVIQDSLKDFLDSPTKLSLLKVNYQYIKNPILPGFIFDDSDEAHSDSSKVTGVPVNLQSISYNEKEMLKQSFFNSKNLSENENYYLYDNEINLNEDTEMYFRGAKDNIFYLKTSNQIYNERPPIDKTNENNPGLEIPFSSHYQALFIKKEDESNLVSNAPTFESYIGINNFGENVFFKHKISGTHFIDFNQGKIDFSIKLNEKDYALTRESFYYFENSNITYNFLINDFEPQNEYWEQKLVFKINQLLNKDNISELQKIKYWNYILKNNLTQDIIYQSENYYSNNPMFTLSNLLSGINYQIEIKCYTFLDEELKFSHSFQLRNNFIKYYKNIINKSLSDSGVEFDWKDVIDAKFSFAGNENGNVINIGDFEDVIVDKDGGEYTFSMPKKIKTLRTIIQPKISIDVHKEVTYNFLNYTIGDQSVQFWNYVKENDGIKYIDIKIIASEDIKECGFEIPLIENYENEYFLDIIGNYLSEEDKFNISINLIYNDAAIIPGYQNYVFEESNNYQQKLNMVWIVKDCVTFSIDNFRNNTLNSVNFQNANCYSSYALSGQQEIQLTKDVLYTPEKNSWNDLIDFNPIYCLDFSVSNNRLGAGMNAINPEIFYEIKVIRQLENQNTFSTVWENINYPTHFVDYSLPNNTKATYWVHPISTENIRYEPIQIKDVYNYNHQWTLLVCDDVYENDILNKNKVEVKEIYYFDKNIQSGSVTNNAEISIVKNFTQFPKYQVSNSNYWSGSLTGLVGYIGEDLITYHQTVEMVNKLAKLSNDGKRKFLKDIEGNIWEIAVSAPVSIQNTDNLGIQLKTKTLSWTQIGDAKNIMIYSQAPIGKEGTDYAY